MADQELQTDANDQPRRATLAWMAHPWILLTASLAILVGGWVGAGVLAEARRKDAVYRLEHEGRVDLNSFPGCGLVPATGRLPAWLPEFVGDRLPPSWQCRSTEFWDCRFLGRATDADVVLVNRIPELARIKFDDAAELSEACLLNVIAGHDLSKLSFEAPYRPTPAQYTALSEKEKLSSLSTLAGPFDQHAIDSVSQLQGLDDLTLDGPATAADLSGLTKLSFERDIEWRHSHLTDQQFSQLDGRGRFSRLELKETRLTAKSWPLLATLNAKSLSLESPHITDETLNYLAKNENLTSISLYGGLITDQGIAQLSSIPSLSSLQLDTVDLSLTSARCLSRLPKLSGITLLNGSEVTDKWLTELTRLQLEWLDLNHSQVTDAGVATLVNQKELHRLSLADTRVTDACLSTLAMLQPFVADLRYTAITDSGLEHFAKLVADQETHTRLYVEGTQITKAGADEFLQRCPYARIIGVPGGERDDRTYRVMPLQRRPTVLTNASQPVSLSQDTQ